MHATNDRQRKLLHIAFAFFAPASLFGLALAFYQALQPWRGQDFQWSGTWMVWHHIDPWRQVLAGDRHLILLNQIPNYLHETYLLLGPFAAMSFAHARVAWAVTNCLFVLCSTHLIGRYFKLGAGLTWLLALICFTGYPFRTSLGNGQQNLFELLAFCSVLCLGPLTARAAALSCAYVKYNFAPVLVFYLLFCRQWKLLLISALPPVAGLLFVWSLVHTPLLTLAFEPFRVSRNGIVVTAADLMALTRWLGTCLLPHRSVEVVSYLVGLSGSAIYSLHLAKSTYLSERAVLTCLATSSLMLMRHGFYDFVFLIVPIANLPYLSGITIRWICGCILAFFWYGERLAALMPVNLRIVVDLLLLGFVLFSVERSDRRLAALSTLSTDPT